MRTLFRREPGFYRRLWALSLPMILQNLVTTSLGFADTFMVGLLGNAEMAAVTAANVPIFIIQIVIFGFQSGMAVLVSQYWGQQDMENISRSLGVAMYAVTAFSLTLALATFFFPARILRLITPNEALVALGTPYIRIVGFSYVFNGLSSMYAGVQRSTEFPTFGMALFTVSAALNGVLNYILIFGKLGFAPMGVTGAAVATLASRVAEFLIAALFALFSRRLPLRWNRVLRPGLAIGRSFLRYSIPVACNEALWSTGTSMLTVIMGHMANSQDMLAAYSLVGSIDRLSTVLCFGVAGAAAVMVGKEIGQGRDREHVYSVARTLLAVSMGIGLLAGAVLLLLLPVFFQPVLFRVFQLTEGAAYAATCLCLLYALSMPTRSFDVTNVTGVLRAGGDAKVAALIDAGPLWFAAIPLMALLALVIGAPVWAVCLSMQAENVCKCPLGILRFRSGKWINDVTVKGN